MLAKIANIAKTAAKMGEAVGCVGNALAGL